MKRIIITVLTLILILSICVFPAAAASTGSLSMTGAEGKQGDTVTVAVNLMSNPGLITMKFAVNYPNDLELTKVENSGLLGGWTTPAPTIRSPYTIRWADSLATTNSIATGKIVTLTFKIKDSATPGNKTISLMFKESRDAEGGKNTFGNASATIKVNCKSHTYGSYTSTDNTQHSRTCSACGHVEKTNHNWDNGTITKVATCKAAGVKTYTCKTCGGTKTSAIAKLTKHTYSNNCDTACNVCDGKRTIKHTYSNNCDTACNVCKAKRTIKHTYSNNCDTKCNVCSAKRTAPHTYSNSCDTSCNGCKAKRSIKHTYSNNCDTKCNVCKKTRKITHTYKTVTTKATLTKNGKTVKQCSVCGKVSSTKTIKYAKTIKLSTTAYNYDGKVKTPSVTVKDSAGKSLKKNTDYTVTYDSGRKNVGTYTVTIKMKGNYSGTKVLTFKIDPAKTSVSKLTAGKGSITVAWKKASQVTGYQIQYSTSKSFSGAMTVTIDGGSTTKYVLKSLKGKKKYYVRVRTYKTVNGVKIYSAWSASKNIKTK